MRGAMANVTGAPATTMRRRRSSTRALPAVRTVHRSHADGSPAWRAATPPANRAARVDPVARVTIRALQFTRSLLVHATVDDRDLRHPLAPLGVLHGHDLPLRPVEVIGDKGYLLVQVVEGVA
jgi:hypothetical protein